jgi:hypothetical protein
MFQACFPHMETMAVLDVGGTAAAWRLAPVRPARLVLMNVEPPGTLAGAEMVIADACDPPERLRRERFDLVYSNSVIEHVGGHWRRQAFADAVRSLADHHWIQTPYRYFPIEPHYAGPLFQFLPLGARGRLVARWPIGSLATVTDVATCLSQAQNTELLSRTEMRHYFPDSALLSERVLGLTKSLIAVR